LLSALAKAGDPEALQIFLNTKLQVRAGSHVCIEGMGQGFTPGLWVIVVVGVPGCWWP
jgi:hypothetical protein